MISSISQSPLTPCFPESFSVRAQETHKDEKVLSPLNDLPILLPPRLPVALEIMRVMNLQSDSTYANIQETFNHIDDEQKQNKAYRQEQTKAIKEAIEKGSTLSTWEMATKVINCVGAVFTVGLGAVTLATGAGAVAGIALMAAGGLLLANQIVSEVKAWEKLAKALSKGDFKMEQNILWHLNTWSTLATLVLSMGTACFGNFSDSAKNLALAGRVIQGSLAVAAGVTSIGKAVIDYGRYQAQAESKRFDAKLSTTEYNIKVLTEINETNFDLIKFISNIFKKFLRTEAEIHKQLLKR